MLKGSSKKLNITPPIGFKMSGFGERDHGAEGVLNELYANVLVLADENQKVALVTLDLIFADREFVKYVRDAVSAQTDIPASGILLNASHTHSGPDAIRFGDLGKISYRQNPTSSEDAYRTYVLDVIANGIVWANNTLEPVKIGFVQSELLGLGSNRIEADRYMDNTVTVLRVDRMNNTPLALFTQYTCHPTILNASSYLFSGDFISFYQEKVEEVFEDCVALFAQGCAGNVSTRHNRKGFGVEEAKRMGVMLAGEVIKNATLVDTCDQVTLSSLVEPLELKIKEFDSDEVCEAKIKDAVEKMERLKKENAPVALQRTAYVEWQGVDRYYSIKKKIDIETVITEMQLIRIGDWKIITTPGETFGEIGREIRKLDSSGKTVVLAYTNGSVGYIPNYETYKNPIGYEVNVALVNEDSEQRILDVASRLFTKI
jgi:neutral ceramidase